MNNIDALIGLYKQYVGLGESLLNCDICRLDLPHNYFINFKCEHKSCYNCCKQFNDSKCHLCRNYLPDLKVVISSKARLINYYNELGLELFNKGKYKESIKLYEKSLREGDQYSLYQISICYNNLNEFDKGVEYSFKFLLRNPLIINMRKDIDLILFDSYISICSYVYDRDKNNKYLKKIIDVSSNYIRDGFISKIKKLILSKSVFEESLRNNICKYFYIKSNIYNSINKDISVYCYFYIIIFNSGLKNNMLINIYNFLINNYTYFEKIIMVEETNLLLNSETIFPEKEKNILIKIREEKNNITLLDFFNVLYLNYFLNDKNILKKFDGKYLLLFNYLNLFEEFEKNDEYYKNLKLFAYINIDKYKNDLKDKNINNIIPNYINNLLEIINKELNYIKTNKIKDRNDILKIKSELLSLIVDFTFNIMSNDDKINKINNLNEKFIIKKRKKKKSK